MQSEAYSDLYWKGVILPSLSRPTKERLIIDFNKAHSFTMELNWFETGGLECMKISSNNSFKKSWHLENLKT